jgi:hypothetical protein
VQREELPRLHSERERAHPIRQFAEGDDAPFAHQARPARMLGKRALERGANQSFSIA